MEKQESTNELEKLRAEVQRLQDASENYKNFVENAQDLLQQVGPDGFFLYVNTAWTKALGYTLQEARQMRVFDIISPRDKKHCQTLFEQTMTGKNLAQVETSFVAKDGREIFVEGKVTCSRSAGKQTTTFGIFRDITERKVAEKEKDQLLASLQDALQRVRTLNGLLPICSSCNKIKDEHGKWKRLEEYIINNSEADFSHGICPDCASFLYPELYTQDLLDKAEKFQDEERDPHPGTSSAKKKRGRDSQS